MLNSIASKVISAIFSQYIEAIDSSQLEVAIWSGSVHLENVNIQSTALSIHSLPFNVKKGIIGSIDLKFPWTKLSTEACEITIKNIFLVANVADSIITTSDYKSAVKFESKNEQESVSQQGVLKGLLGKIVDNLKFHVENIHIRIEIPLGEKHFAFGLILPEINSISIDENGQPIFVNEDSPLLYKLASIKNLSIYIDSNATQISEEKFIQEMLEEINEDHEFILNPFTFETTIKNHRNDGNNIKNEININTEEVCLNINERQWKCVQEMIRQQYMLKKKFSYSHCGRPDRIPRSDRSSTLWWKYAHRAALEKMKKQEFDVSCAIQILKNKKLYSNLYRENIKNNRHSSIELSNLEESLDTNAIQMLRVISQTEYELNSPLITNDSQTFFDLSNNDTFSGPFYVFLLINSFKITLFKDSGDSITRIVSKSLSVKYKQNGLKSLSSLSFSTFQIINDLNVSFPYILSTEESDNPLVIHLKSLPNTPYKITVNAPTIVFVFDFGWVRSLLQFFSKGKAILNVKDNDDNNAGNKPATILEIQKAIEAYIPYELSMSIKSLILKILYEEVPGDHYFSFNLDNIKIGALPNLFLDAEDFTSLYTHFDIGIEEFYATIDGRQVTNTLAGKVEVDNAIITSDLFPSLKVFVNVNTETIVDITTFEFNLLLEEIMYLQDIYSQFSSYEGEFDPELNILIQIKSGIINIFYEEQQIYQILANPIFIEIIFKDFYDDVRINIGKLLAYDYFSDTRRLLLDSTPTRETLSCKVMITNERREVMVDIGNTVLYGRVKPINFLINFFRFSQDYEVRLCLKDEPDPRNIWHVYLDETEKPKIEITILAEPLLWYLNDDLGTLKTDKFKLLYWYKTFGFDIFLEINHPIISTDQLNEYHTILDTNPIDPLKIEFHTFSISAQFSETKFTLQYLWFIHLVRYFSGLLHYGKNDDHAPNSMIYSNINVEVKHLELTSVYNSEISDNLIFKTPILEMKTIKVPTLFQFICKELEVFHLNKLFIKTPQLIIDMPLDLASYEEGKMFDEIPHEKQDLYKMIADTNKFFESNPNEKELNSINLWIIGMGLNFSLDNVFFDYSHIKCRTFRKCLYSLWEYDGPHDAYSLDFKFFLKLADAHLILSKKNQQFADIRMKNFSYSIIEKQEISFGDLLIFPVKSVSKNDKTDSEYNRNIIDKLDSTDNPLLLCYYEKFTFTMNIGHINIFLHPTFAFELLYYIIACPLFGEKDDPPSEQSTKLVFKSDNMMVTIPTKPDFWSYIFSFGFLWEWSDDEFFINLLNFTGRCENSNIPIINPITVQYKRVKDEIDGDEKTKFSKKASITEMKCTITLLDIILLNLMLNNIKTLFNTNSNDNGLEGIAYNSISTKSNNSTNENNMMEDLDFRSMNIKILICHSTLSSSSCFPFMKLKLKPLSVSLHPDDNAEILKTKIIPSLSIMNFTTGKWDSLIEEFAIDFLVSSFENHHEISVNSLEEININIPSVVVNQILEFEFDFSLNNEMLNKKASINSIASSFIENRTGSSVMIFYGNDNKVISLPAGSQIPLKNQNDEKENIISVSFGDTAGQLCNFNPSCIAYPVFIHQRCVLNSIAYQGSRLITLSSPFAVQNNTSISLDIFSVNKNWKQYLGKVEPHKIFYIPYTVFLTNGFLFKESDPTVLLENPKHKIFKHNQWKTKVNRSMKIITSNGPLACKIREEIDSDLCIGLIKIYPIITFINEMPVDLYVKLSRSKSNILKIHPGEQLDISNISPLELNFGCHVRIEGFDFSKKDIISFGVDSVKPKKIYITKEDKSYSTFISVIIDHPNDRSQAVVFFFCPCLIFNLFGKPIFARAHNEDLLFYPEKYKPYVNTKINSNYELQNQEYQLIMFGTNQFYINQELFTEIICPDLSDYSKNYIDCSAKGVDDIIFLPKLCDSEIFVPLRYNISEALPPFTHSSILTFVPALSVTNEMNINIQIIPHLSREISTDSFKNNGGLLIEPQKKELLLWSNETFTFDFILDGYDKVENILLSSPVKTVFRIFKADSDDFLLVECEVVEDGFGLCSHFRKPNFPTPYILCNYLEDVKIVGFQLSKRNQFIFPSMSTTIFGFDSPFGEHAFVLEINGKDIAIKLFEEILPLPLSGTPYTIEIRTVNFGNKLIIISQNPVTKPKRIYQYSLFLNGISISFIDSMMRELCLLHFGSLNATIEATQDEIVSRISLDSFQLDDQCSVVAFPVVFSGQSNKNNKFLQINFSFYRDAPYLASFKTFTFAMQKMVFYIDLAFLSDFLSYLFSISNHTNHYFHALVPPSKNKESKSVGWIYSFKKLYIKPFLVTIYYRSVTGRPLTLPTYPELPLTLFKFIGNITGANICLNSILLKNFRAPMSFLQRNILQQYKNSLLNQIWSLTGHSDILFNTVGIAESFTSSIETDFHDPEEDTEELNSSNEILEVKASNKDKKEELAKSQSGELAGKRAKKAVGSILQSSEGVLRGFSSLFSVSTFGTRSINTGGLNQLPEETVRDGFLSLGTSFLNGIVGIVMDPVEGGKQDGVRGAFVGLGKGLVGVFVKPIVGILDAGAGIIGGVRQAINANEQKILTRHRNPNAFLLSRIVSFDQVASYVQIMIQQHGWNQKNTGEVLYAMINDPNNEFILCVCTKSIYFLKKNDKYTIAKDSPVEKIIQPSFEGNLLKFSLTNILKKDGRDNFCFNCNNKEIAEQIAMIMFSKKISDDVFK